MTRCDITTFKHPRQFRGVAYIVTTYELGDQGRYLG